MFHGWQVCWKFLVVQWWWSILEPEVVLPGNDSRTVDLTSLPLNDVSGILHLHYFAEGKTHLTPLSFIPKTAEKHWASFLKRGEWEKKGKTGGKIEGVSWLMFFIGTSVSSLLYAVVVFTPPFVSIPQTLTWTHLLEKVTLSHRSEVHLSSHPWMAMLFQVRTFLTMISQVNSCSLVFHLLLGNAYKADGVSAAEFWLSWTWTVLQFSLGLFWFLPCFWHHFLMVSPFLMTYLSVEIIGILCLKQMSEITQIKVAIRKILFYI